MIQNCIKYILFFLVAFSTFSQVSNLKTKYDLPQTVKETSGLLVVDGKIITHNDSGDAANLYELDSVTGNLLRTINITNATNVDWEDIALDDTHIYVADIGNNNGNRTDLTIYKILKTDFANNTSITAEEITFAYEDQTDFTIRTNNHNFDDEAIVIFNDDILIFTKNWENEETNVYKIPKVSGDYTATKVSNADVECLITGATYFNDRFFLSAYDASLNPFIIYISFNRAPGDDIFASGFTKIDITSTIGGGSQIEGITAVRGNSDRYFLSREEFSFTSGGSTFTFPTRLYEFTDDTHNLLSTKSFDKLNVSIFPNPTTDSFSINSTTNIVKIQLFNTLGKLVLADKYNQQKFDISKFPSGIYLLKVTFDNQQTTVKKIIKR